MLPIHEKSSEQKILEGVKGQPGITMAEMARYIDRPYYTTRYQVWDLAINNKLRIEKKERVRLYPMEEN